MEQRPIRFLLGLCALYGLGHAAYYAIPDAVLRDALIHHGIVSPGAWAIHLLAPVEDVVASGNVLQSSRATLEVVRGCDGVGTALLLAAAILAYRAPIARKLGGLVFGLAVVYAVNLARIVGLYFIAAYRGDWFPVLHGYVIPVAFVTIVAVFFAGWLANPVQDGHARAALP